MIKIEYLARYIQLPGKRNLFIDKENCEIYDISKLHYPDGSINTKINIHRLDVDEKSKECINLNEEEIKNRYIQVPHVQPIEISLAFLKKLPECEIKNLISLHIGQKDYWNYFDNYIGDDYCNKYGFSNDYDNFFEEYPIQKAKEFCDKNGIEYE